MSLFLWALQVKINYFVVNPLVVTFSLLSNDIFCIFFIKHFSCPLTFVVVIGYRLLCCPICSVNVSSVAPFASIQIHVLILENFICPRAAKPFYIIYRPLTNCKTGNYAVKPFFEGKHTGHSISQYVFLFHRCYKV